MASATPSQPQGPDIFALWAAGLSPTGVTPPSKGDTGVAKTPVGKRPPGPGGDGKLGIGAGPKLPHHLGDKSRGGELARSLARHEHLKFFAEVNEGPQGAEEKPASAVADSIRREAREEEVQGRYEQQQTTYASAASQKHKYGILLKKQIRKFNMIVRNFRRALADLRKAQASKEPTYLAASVGRLIDAGSMITEHIHELLSMTHHIKSFDVQIKSASSLVKKEEIRPDDVSQEMNRQELSNTTQVKLASRSNEALDSSASMEVGHYETDWAAEACKDALDLIGEGMAMMEGTLQDNVELNRQRREGQNAGVNPQGAQYRCYELASASMGREQANLRAALRQLMG